MMRSLRFLAALIILGLVATIALSANRRTKRDLPIRPAATRSVAAPETAAAPAARSAEPAPAVLGADGAPKSDTPKAEATAGEKPAADDGPVYPTRLEDRARPDDLGKPLVENADKLIRLHPKHYTWIDKANKRVVVQGVVCGRAVPLEMFACVYNVENEPPETKQYESILSIYTAAYLVHTALVTVGAEPGNPAHFYPNYEPARGTEVDIEVLWKDDQGKIRKRRGQELVRYAGTKRHLRNPWIFAGSGFWTDPETKKQHYKAESGDLICVANFTSATLDLNMRSSASNEELEFECFTERIPAKNTPVTLVLTPKLK